MKKLTCEMCGSTDLIKQDGIFVCQTCGTKYSVEDAKKMMSGETVEVTGSVKVDVSEKVQNLYVMARRAKDENNAELAAKYYEMISIENPNDWESMFYFNYFKAKNTTLGDMRNSVYRFDKSLDSVFAVIDKTDKSEDEKWAIIEEILEKVDSMGDSFLSWAKSHYRKFSDTSDSIDELEDRAWAIADMQKNMALRLSDHYFDRSKEKQVQYMKSYVENYLLKDTLDKRFIDLTLKYYSDKLLKAEEYIKVIDPTYQSLIGDTAKENADGQVVDNGENSGEMIQVNYSLGHYNYQNYWYSSPNSSGGVSVRVSLKNIGTKAIKYCSLHICPYNAVNDKVGTKKILQLTGPIAPNRINNGSYWENVWYDITIRYAKIEYAEVEFMDGTTKKIPGEQILTIGARTANGAQNNGKKAPPMPIGAKICYILCAVAPILVPFCLSDFLDSLGDTGLIIFLSLMIGLPIIFAIIGSILYNKPNKKAAEKKKNESDDKNEHQK